VWGGARAPLCPGRGVAGDSVGGSAYVSSILQDRPTIEALNAMSLDASALGNHELDQGLSDLETRIAILRKKAASQRLTAGTEVLEHIASHITTNIRELEGALIRVTAFASLNKQPVDQTLAEMVLKDIISDPEGQEITTSLIMAQTADYFGITIDDLCSANRSRTMVSARHIAMYLCRELTDLSLPKIGREFGGRDHSTVLNSVKKADELRQEDAEIAQDYEKLLIIIKN